MADKPQAEWAEMEKSNKSKLTKAETQEKNTLPSKGMIRQETHAGES
ncbi:thymosin beta-4-like [Arvicanthis niloticus]|nr:thymosin beta-4-like [Arvicanthis niloticus]